MIGSTRTLRVWAYPEPADLRTGCDGLAALVTAKLGRDPLSGISSSSRIARAREPRFCSGIGTGLCIYPIYQKRLEQGRFACLWKATGSGAIELTMSELTLFLEGSRWSACSSRRRSSCRAHRRPRARRGRTSVLVRWGGAARLAV